MPLSAWLIFARPISRILLRGNLCNRLLIPRLAPSRKKHLGRIMDGVNLTMVRNAAKISCLRGIILLIDFPSSMEFKPKWEINDKPQQEKFQPWLSKDARPRFFATVARKSQNGRGRLCASGIQPISYSAALLRRYVPFLH